MISQKPAVPFLAILLASGALCACSGKDAPTRTGEPADDATAASGTSGAPDAPAAAPQPDEVLVTVNGVPVKAGECNERAEQMAAQQYGGQLAALPPEFRANAIESAREQALENLIVERLLDGAITDGGITASDEEVLEVVATYRESLPEGVTLEQQIQQMPMSMEGLQDVIRTDLCRKKLFETQFTSIADPDDDEVFEFYAANQQQFAVPESVEARHILIGFTPEDDEAVKEEKRTRAAALREQLLAEDAPAFEDLARNESDCPSSAEGGYLGKFTRGQMVPEFETAAFEQEVGDVGPVVETQFGCHVILVTGHEEAGEIPLTEAREDIVARIQQTRRNEAVQQLIEELRAQATIVHPGEAAVQPGPEGAEG